MQVEIEHIEYLTKERQKINKASLKTMVFTKNGVVVPIPIEIRDAFELTGLNNIDFIISGFYKESSK